MKRGIQTLTTPDDAEIVGVITAIDPSTSSVTVMDQHGEMTITVLPETEIDSDGPGVFGELEVGMEVEVETTLIEVDDEAQFGELEVGMEVEVKYDPDALTAYEIEVELEDDDSEEDEDDD